MIRPLWVLNQDSLYKVPALEFECERCTEPCVEGLDPSWASLGSDWDFRERCLLWSPLLEARRHGGHFVLNCKLLKYKPRALFSLLVNPAGCSIPRWKPDSVNGTVTQEWHMNRLWTVLHNQASHLLEFFWGIIQHQLRVCQSVVYSLPDPAAVKSHSQECGNFCFSRLLPRKVLWLKPGSAKQRAT